MRINMSSRELRSALATFSAAASALTAHWEAEDKLVQLVAYRVLTSCAEDLAVELEHPEYEHARAARLARELFDAGIAVVEIIDEDLRGTVSPSELRVVRGATLGFMETVAMYLSPFAA
jgi:hypothetical protein